VITLANSGITRRNAEFVRTSTDAVGPLTGAGPTVTDAVAPPTDIFPTPTGAVRTPALEPR